MALRAQRLGLVNAPLSLLAEVQLEAIIATIGTEKPEVVVIDSIQTVYTEALTSAPGSVAQVRECAAQLTRLAKQRGIVVLFVGHVTKEGAIAGPRVLEHIVDTVLYFEGDTHSSFRLVRAIKNRFGAANELGVFAMTERGLKGVANPSALFLSQHAEPIPGSAIVATLEGSRPLLVEIQALVDPVQGGTPQRLAVGLDPPAARAAAGGAASPRRRSRPAATTYSSTRSAACASTNRRPISRSCWPCIRRSSVGRFPAKTLVFGEVGLAGEIRPVQRGQDRIKEAAKLGFRQFLIPTLNKPRQAIDSVKIMLVDRVDQAVRLLRE